jgi:hypothetical protein
MKIGHSHAGRSALRGEVGRAALSQHAAKSTKPLRITSPRYDGAIAACCPAFRRFPSSVAILLLTLMTGCSTFNKEWRAAAKTTPTPNSIQGRWTGEWRSQQNNHHGQLRAVITQTSPTTYRAHYKATYKTILHFSYIATLNATDTNSPIKLSGQADLRKLAGGIYKYEATATPTNFQSTYTSKYDHGHYEMTRP